MNDRDFWTLKAMDIYGGSFIKQLAVLARHADSLNLQKIKDTWYFYWRDYEELGEVLKQESK